MSRRIGKYKVGGKDIALSAVDGATISGNLDGIGNLTATGTSTLTTANLGPTSFGSATGFKLTSATVTTATIAVTDDTDNTAYVTQPAGTIIRDIIAIPAGNIVTAGSDGNDLQLEIGTAESGGQLLAFTDILKDGGGAVTWTANVPLNIIKNSHGQAADAFATAGIGPLGGPATTAAIVIAGALYSSADRAVWFNWRAKGADLATAATTIKHIVVFQYV